MRKLINITLLSAAIAFMGVTPSKSYAFSGGGCGTACLAEMRGFCPTCGYNPTPASYMPWGTPAPFYWNTGPMMFSNFYAPAPWSYVPPAPSYAPMNYPSPGVVPGFFPGGGGVFMAKPNLYVLGTPGTKVNIKLKFVEEGTNWLAAVPTHGTEGWQATLTDGYRVRVNDVTYGYLYSDYRVYGKPLQDTEGFCSPKETVLNRMAIEMKGAGFTEREIKHFLEYWTVKLPQSESYCVYPQDERQLDQVAALEITPKPAAVRRLLFLVQVKEGLRNNGDKFTKPPKNPWKPSPLRTPAAADPKAVVVHEWGVGFLAAKH
jgi:hypothetical protein